jgi:hypothetical protein
MDEMIAEFECAMTRILLLSGYSPHHWRQMLDVIILNWDGLTNLSNNSALSSSRQLCILICGLGNNSYIRVKWLISPGTVW